MGVSRARGDGGEGRVLGGGLKVGRGKAVEGAEGGRCVLQGNES